MAHIVLSNGSRNGRTGLKNLLPAVLGIEKIGDFLGFETGCTLAKENRKDDG